MPEPTKQVLLSLEGLEAWRQLRLSQNAPYRLVSGTSFIWHPGRWERSGHEHCTIKVPHEIQRNGQENKSCTCGIYAYKERGQANQEFQVYGLELHCEARVRLSLAGRVLRYTKGFRATYARIREIELVYFDETYELQALARMVSLQESYAVPCKLVYLKHEGITPVPSGALPPAKPREKRLTMSELLFLLNDGTLDARLQKVALAELRQRVWHRKKALQSRIVTAKLMLANLQQEWDELEAAEAYVHAQRKGARSV